jgi:hypothetical protein
MVARRAVSGFRGFERELGGQVCELGPDDGLRLLESFGVYVHFDRRMSPVAAVEPVVSEEAPP